MVSARRSFVGTLPVASMPRLCGMLAGSNGEVDFELEFGRDELGMAYLDVRAEAPLTVTCQRSLESFVLPVAVHSRLGLIRSEREESGLSPDCEPLLVDDDGKLALADVIEDELLLALPLVPINPDSVLPEEVTSPPTDDSADEGRTDNPFAVLRELKK
ncbi:YceD family protein [Dyella sp.]|uniref:YceD family protein n=1 Tax=Dyella sp. TaxID=1869338 RepID=UPI003F7E90BE